MQPAAAESGAAARVLAYLKAHPDFLLKNPDLLEVLTPPGQHNGRNVLDMGQFMVRRLQEELEQLRRQQGELLETSRVNMRVQGRVHSAVLTMLEATSFEHLIHIVTKDLPDLLDVDAVTLCVEQCGNGGPRTAPTSGVFVLDGGAIDDLLGARNRVLLSNDGPFARAVFGPAAGLVRSQALVRLTASPTSPVGLLALGSRDPEKFRPGQGSELLEFLAQYLERLFRAWLDLPS